MLKTAKNTLTNKKILTILLIVASSGLTMNVYSFAQDGTFQVDKEIGTAIAIGGVLLGTLASVAKGISDRPDNEPIKVGRIFSAFITGFGASVILIKFPEIAGTIGELGYIGALISYFMIGLMGDQSLAHMDK